MELVYPVGGNVNWHSPYGNSREVLPKIKKRTINDPEILLLSIYPK